jgi:uncharacterized protein YlzI (FlbEa/FlbD family)
MIKLTYLDGDVFCIHVDEIRETSEYVTKYISGTLLKTTNNKRIVKESMEDVVKMVNIYRKTYMSPSINQHQGRDFR